MHSWVYFDKLSPITDKIIWYTTIIENIDEDNGMIILHDCLDDLKRIFP